MKLRKIKLRWLGINSVLYRIHIILALSLFFYFKTGEWKWAVGTSMTWSIINFLLYLNWHYWFSRLVKMGKNNNKGGDIK